EGERALTPERRGSRRQKRLRHLRGTAHKRFRFRPEGEFDSFDCAEEVRDDRVAAAFHFAEEERGALALDDAAVNLGEFKVRVNLRLDGDDVAFAPEKFEERAEVSVHAAASKAQGARLSNLERERRGGSSPTVREGVHGRMK